MMHPIGETVGVSTAEYDYALKVLLIGDCGVGKSSLLVRFADDIYEEAYAPTIGVDFKISTLAVEGKKAKVMLWDTAGAERFRTITSSYYRGSHGVVVVYDVTDRESFRNVTHWIQEIQKYCCSDIAIMMVGNKCDQSASSASPACSAGKVVQESEAIEFVEGVRDAYPGVSIDFMQTSAKLGTNVEEAFTKLIKKIMLRVAAQESKTSEKLVLASCPKPPKSSVLCCSSA